MNYYIGLICLLLTIGCSLKGNDSLQNKTADKLYMSGKAFMRSGNYEDAVTKFKDIESLFPYSSRAGNGQILMAYCYFMSSNYVESSREIEVFLRYHPTHPLVSYAMYLRAMCAYIQVSSSGRDSRIAYDAKQLFTEIVNRFPDSIYYHDAMKRILILDNIIASNEMVIGKYYQKKKNVLSAVSRYNFVINQFAHTSSAAEAYYRIFECCRAMGLEAEAMAAYGALKNNFPNSKWANSVKNIDFMKNK